VTRERYETSSVAEPLRVAGDELEPFEEWAEMLGDGAPRVPREARTCPVR
jgi:hypothetical protein